MTDFSNLPNSISFHEYFQPGIYMILNINKNKCYIGETENIADRLASHFKRLNSNKPHACAELQTDWNFQNGQNFVFKILFFGPEWSERSVRLQKEREIVLSFGQENVYNFTKYIDSRIQRQSIARTIRRNSIPVIVHGILYPSIREAAHMNNMTISTAV